MPHMNGFATLKAIRQTLHDKTATVVMVSSVTDKQDIVACVKLGVQGYVLKPFEVKNLAATVVGYHRKHKKSQRSFLERQDLHLFPDGMGALQK